MNKQRIRYLTAGLVAVALLAACGSDDDSGEESSSTEAATDGTEAATESTEAAAEGTAPMGECDELVPVSGVAVQDWDEAHAIGSLRPGAPRQFQHSREQIRMLHESLGFAAIREKRRRPHNERA